MTSSQSLVDDSGFIFYDSVPVRNRIVYLPSFIWLIAVEIGGEALRGNSAGFGTVVNACNVAVSVRLTYFATVHANKAADAQKTAGGAGTLDFNVRNARVYFPTVFVVTDKSAYRSGSLECHLACDVAADYRPVVMIRKHACVAVYFRVHHVYVLDHCVAANDSKQPVVPLQFFDAELVAVEIV